MRKSAWILAGLIIVASVALAATSGTTTTATTTTTKTVAKWDHTSGEVTAVDATAKTLTVKAKAGDKSFKWDDKTAVTPKGSSPAVGDHVTVTTAKDSDMATKIAIRKAKATKPAA
jgi:maltose-binding protein MalE